MIWAYFILVFIWALLMVIGGGFIESKNNGITRFLCEDLKMKYDVADKVLIWLLLGALIWPITAIVFLLTTIYLLYKRYADSVQA